MTRARILPPSSLDRAKDRSRLPVVIRDDADAVAIVDGLLSHRAAKIKASNADAPWGPLQEGILQGYERDLSALAQPGVAVEIPIGGSWRIAVFPEGT